MYPIFLAVHNILRWVALILGVVAFVRALAGLSGKREWGSADRRLGMFYTSAMDLQFLVGLILFIFLSPFSTGFFGGFPGSFSNATFRFFGLFHPLVMVLAVVFAHVGSASARKADDSRTKHKRLALWFGLSLLLIVLAIPWGAPLLPGL